MIEKLSAANHLGVIQIPMVSYRKDSVHIETNPASVFPRTIYDPESLELSRLPLIVPGKSTFDLQIKSLSGTILRVQRIQVNEVTQYEYSTAAKIMKLSFTYKEVYSPDIGNEELTTTVDPIVSHIIPVSDEIIVFILEGTEDACTKAADETYQTVNHDGKIYYQYNTKNLKVLERRDSAGNPVWLHLATVIFFNSLDITPSEDDQLFAAMIVQGCMGIWYNITFDDSNEEE